ncbi:methionyl-tRNA formyltransferase [Sulfuriflexus mobilis]|uniref:methionyl-tRNA formyltransferase n=1 Tax=Sulfuriflexus mobilis TaxID=1811807 RepID=UPI000F844841|nr:methionyl-tRNA formyltransferase [Sulfuriflexus mobilis]
MEALNIVFAGTPDFAVPSLQALLDSPHHVKAVYTQPDRPAGRGRKLSPGPVKQCALDHGLPVEQPLSLKDPTEQAKLAAYQPDIMVVVAYGMILPAAILAIPRLGCINVHASLLPRWRGAAPIQRAILAGDAQTGVTIMQMAEGLDTGDMLARVSVAIGVNETAAELHDRLAPLGNRALLEVIGALAASTAQPEVQDDALSNYAVKLSKSEAPLDWRRPAGELHRQVCAFNPYPVAQATLDGDILRIWRSEISATHSDAKPGTVIAAGGDGIEVATGDGVLRLTEVQAAGKRRMSAADFVNARPTLRNDADGGVCFDVEG